jgi:hypothetical protein
MWCKKEHIKYAFFTHCGSQIVKLDYNIAQEKLKALGLSYNVNAELAYDGMYLSI